MFRWHRSIAVLGLLLIAGAIGRAITTLAAGGLVLEAVLDSIFLGTPGVVLLIVGAWLPSTDIEPQLHARIVAWIVGGIAILFGVIALRVLHPGVDVGYTFGTQAASLAIGSLAGVTIGVHEARAITHARTLERRNEQLKEKRAVERRNDELEETKAKLECAITQLERSNKRLEEFAYAASHDLQEPLRMVSSYLRLIEQRYGDSFDEDGEEFLEYAVDGAERMRAMIDGLLAYARVETQGRPFEAVDLETVFEDVLADLQFRIEETEASIACESLPTVTGDGDQLRQVLQNLLSNAIEYSGDEPPRVTVSGTRTDADSEWAISVRDEGVGIEPDDADRVFAIFQRLHSAEECAGSGIGLAMCKRIVERHGGEIRLESEPGRGSTFSFTVPGASG